MLATEHEHDGTTALDSAPGSDASPTDATETLTADATEPVSDGTSTLDAAGQPRDERGRFSARSGDQTAGDDAAPVDDDPLTPDAHPDGDPAASLTAAAETGEPAPADQPYTFLHRNQMHGVDGAVVKPDGSLVVGASSVPRIGQMLARAREMEVFLPKREAEWTRRVQEMEHRIQTQAQTRHAGIEGFGKLLDGNPDLETFLTRAAHFFESLPALKEQLTREELDARDRRIAELEGRAPAAMQPNSANGAPQGAQPGQITREEIEQAAVSKLGQMLVQARQVLPEFKGFTDSELEALMPELHERRWLYVRPANQRDAELYDVQIGEPIFDADRFEKELRLVSGDRIRAKRAATVKPAIDDAAKRNAAVLNKPKVPPVPRSGAEVATGPDDEQFETMDDFVAWGSGVRKRRSG